MQSETLVSKTYHGALISAREFLGLLPSFKALPLSRGPLKHPDPVRLRYDLHRQKLNKSFYGECMHRKEALDSGGAVCQRLWKRRQDGGGRMESERVL